MFAQHHGRTSWILALTLLVAGGSAAPAFYWVGWPGVEVRQPPQIISKQVVVEHRNPKPPGPNPPPGGGEETEPPGGVPEPTSVLLLGAGLATAAGVRWVRKKRRASA